MLNDYCEEMDMEKRILDFHEQELSKFEIPRWMREIHCPFCDAELELKSFRNIRLCFNARNIGDIAIEVLCYKCNKMDSVYFREDIKNLCDFTALIDKCDGSGPQSSPIVEAKMFKMMYNNLVEKMMEQEKQEREGA